MARVLFVTGRLPHPPQEGHQLRSWHLLRAAAAAGHDVTLLSLVRPEEAGPPSAELSRTASVQAVALPEMSALRSLVTAASVVRGRTLLEARYITGALTRAFERLVAGADLVHLDILAVAALIERVPPDLPVVFNAHNVESRLLAERVRSEPARWRRAVLASQVRRLARMERRVCSAADRVLACSDIDAERLQALAPAARVTVVPNGVDLAGFCPGADPAGDDRTLVFVGQMSWFPNRDGIEHFLAAVWPRIRQRHPARLRIIGRDGDTILPPAPGVERTGFVADLRPLIESAAVYVVPLRVGSGTRLKLLEAMAMGKAIVTTRIGAEGLGLVDGTHALLADSPEAFAGAVARLLDDRALRLRLGLAARQLAEQRYGWDAIGARLNVIYADLLTGAGRVRTNQHAAEETGGAPVSQ